MLINKSSIIIISIIFTVLNCSYSTAGINTIYGDYFHGVSGTAK